MNWHKALLGVFTSVGGAAAALPFPWNYVVGTLAAGGAGLFVRGSQISDKVGELAKNGAGVPARTST
jgi:hypothetical protein